MATSVHQTHNRDDVASNRVGFLHLVHETSRAPRMTSRYGRVAHNQPPAPEPCDERP
jgi:hypothetical protein